MDIFFIVLTACTERGRENKTRYGDRIKNADKIELFFKDIDTVYHHNDSSKELVKEFVNVLNGRTENDACPTEGEIRFYSKDSMLFLAAFSISDGRKKCNHIKWKGDAWRLTYRAGMFLNETLAEKRRRDE